MLLYLTRNGEVLGPYEKEQVRRDLQAGKVQEDDLGCIEGETHWQRLSVLFAPPKLVPATVPALAPVPVAAAPAGALARQAVFTTAFLGMFLGGGLLSVCWYAFLHGRTATPPVLVAPSAHAQVEKPVATPPPKMSRVNGEMVVVTKDGQKQKLGGVLVGLYKQGGLYRFLQQKQAASAPEVGRVKRSFTTAVAERSQAEANAQQATDRFNAASDDITRAYRQKDVDYYAQLLRDANSEYERWLKEMKVNSSGEYVFKDMPPPAVTAETDAEGKFSLQIPGSGDFVLVAHASRGAGETAESFYWMVKFFMDEGGEERVVLNNGNVTSSTSAESLVKTVD